MKIRVMVVDDEPIAAQATALLVGQAEEDIEIVSICFSGRDAVVNARRLSPDLVIMDIHMPGINGLEAMERIRRDCPSAEFIFLSAYSKFGYAVEALSLGALNYLLKPVSQEELDATIQKAVTGIRLKKREMDRELQQRERMEIAEPMIQKDFIQSLMSGADSDEKLIACATFLGLGDKSAFIMALSGWSEAGVQATGALLDQLGLQTELIYDFISPKLAVACVPVPYEASPQEYAEKVTARLEQLMSEQEQSGTELVAGRGEPVSSPVDLKTSLRQAITAINCEGTTFGTPRCIVFDSRTMDLWTSEIGVEKAALPVSSAGSARQILDHAVQYIHKNYSRNLSLDEIAAEVNLSTYYFSRLFKESTGVNFSEMLLRVRIDRARELLLEPGSSVKDVAFQVGFNDPSYFSKVFHKATGIRASNYRTLQKHGKHEET